MPCVDRSPSAAENSLLLRGSDYRDEERCEASDDVFEFRLLHIRLVLVTETVPLLDLVFILVELRCERKRYTVRWQIGTALLDGRSNGAGQRFPIECKSVGKTVQIVEVLHAAVRDPESYHGFEFFRDYGFARVGE